LSLSQSRLLIFKSSPAKTGKKNHHISPFTARTKKSHFPVENDAISTEAADGRQSRVRAEKLGENMFVSHDLHRDKQAGRHLFFALIG